MAVLAKHCAKFGHTFFSVKLYILNINEHRTTTIRNGRGRPNALIRIVYDYTTGLPLYFKDI